MTNPDNAVGTNGAFGGRTSVNAFNDDLAVYTRGIMSGWACSPNSGLTVSLGGDGSTRDVAVAEDNAGNKTTINNISGSPIDVTMSAAPGANSRIDAIVAYVDNPPQGSDTVADNYEACGLIAVDGTPSASPTAPDDNDIRSAITADGASGATAYYVVLANITIENGTTDITSGDITAGPNAGMNALNINYASLFPQTVNTETATGIIYNGKTVYAQRFTGSSSFTNGTRKEVDLATCSDRPVILQTFGWFTAGDYATTSSSPLPQLAGVSNVGGYAMVIGTTDKKIKFRVLPGSTATYNWDFVVFYFKD